MKKLILFISAFITMFSLNSSAQITNYFSVLWNLKYQHSDTDFMSNETRKIAVDTSTGNIFVLADVVSDIDASGTTTTNTYNYTVILKYDAAGSLINSVAIDVNQHTVAGYDQKSGFGLELDASGNVYVGYMSYNASSDIDVKLAKYNSNLINLWTYTYNPTSNDQGIDMKISPGGSMFAIVKSISGGVNIRYRVIKATGTGTSALPFCNFNSAPDVLNSLTVDAASNVFVTGSRQLSGVKSILTASVNNSGVLNWTNLDNCGTVTGDDIGKHITIGVDGFIYITGSSVGTVQHGVDVVSIKYGASNGKKVWANFINYNLTDGGVFINVAEPNIATVSWVASNTVFVDQLVTTTGLGGRRASYSPIPSGTYTSLNGASVTDMVTSPAKNIYVTGNIQALNGAQSFTSSYLIKVNFASRTTTRIELQTPVAGTTAQSNFSKSIALHPFNKTVVWAQDLIQNSSNHQQEKVSITALHGGVPFRMASDISDNELQSYPSPAIDQVTFTSQNSIAELEIYNLTGQQLLNQKIENSSMFSSVEIIVNNFSPGIYFAVAKNNDGTVSTTKFIIK